jgi:large subunit ribosomal protein L21
VYAVIKSGGRQYKVEPGEVIEVNRLPVEVGQTIDLDHVLMIGGSENGTVVGQPTIPGARVLAHVSGNPRSRKIIVFKYKNKTRYRRFNTHRQDLTRLVIREIVSGGDAPVASAEAVVETSPEGTPEVNGQVAPDVTAEATPEVTAEVAPDVTAEATPEVTAEVTPDVTAESVPATSEESAAEEAVSGT